MTLGEKIKHFCSEKWVSMYEAAEALSVKREQLYPYFNDTVKPGALFFTELRKYGCDLNWLLNEQNNSVKEPASTYSAGNEVKQLREEVKELRKVINQINKLIEQTKK